MPLDDLPPSYSARLCGAKDPEAWRAHCADGRAVAWVAWNVVHDAWCGAEELAKIQVAIDDAPLDKLGPELLLQIAPRLKGLRALSTEERGHLPRRAVTHVAENWLGDSYVHRGLSVGTRKGEARSTLREGDVLRVAPRRDRSSFRWLTFEASAPVPIVPDEVVQQLGLDWKPSDGVVLRIDVPLGTLLDTGAEVNIPTVFNGLGAPVKANWRARPLAEHRADEPWGMARDMRLGTSALPEVLANIMNSVEMRATCLGPLQEDWSDPPFLAGSTPR
ncbi:hypothetical protein WME89_33665 [Sorangium sp. So ce321]|uniref:hypothetical protein n=1 Tax=Sorangium sp. So ce321 TaxID=3133300 RepID=UPI003F6083CB